MARRKRDPEWTMAWLEYATLAHREGWNFTTAYGAYRKHGGKVSAAVCRRIWRLAKLNPFRKYQPC